MNTEKTQKYDPCRLFRKGDKVRVQHFRGRCGSSLVPSGNTAIVIDSEDENCLVVLNNPSRFGKPTIVIHSCFLELVTPVEDLEPYSVEEEAAFDDDEPCGIIHIYYNYNGGRDKVRTFYENGPESWNATKAAAEAECKRMNAEYSKSTINN